MSFTSAKEIPASSVQLPAALSSDDRLKVTLTPPFLLSEAANFTVTDSYTSVFAGAVARTKAKEVTFRVKELNYYAVYYKILAGPAADDLDEIQAETLLAKNGVARAVFADPTMYVDIQCKNAVAGQVAHVKASLTVG